MNKDDAIKTAQQRWDALNPACPQQGSTSFKDCQDAEIAELRAALRATAHIEQGEAVACVVSQSGNDLRVGWLRPEQCKVGDQLFRHPAPVEAQPVARCSHCNGARGWGAGEDAESCTACDEAERKPTPAPAAGSIGDDELPPLPQSTDFYEWLGIYKDKVIREDRWYSADQMRQYAIDARSQPPAASVPVFDVNKAEAEVLALLEKIQPAKTYEQWAEENAKYIQSADFWPWLRQAFDAGLLAHAAAPQPPAAQGECKYFMPNGKLCPKCGSRHTAQGDANATLARNALNTILWLYRRLPRGYEQQPMVEALALELAAITGQDIAECLAERATAPAAQGEWSEYLREGETPIERLRREIKDSDSLATLLADEKRKNAAQGDADLSARDAAPVPRSLAEIDADLSMGGGLGRTARLIGERQAAEEALRTAPAQQSDAGLSEEDIAEIERAADILEQEGFDATAIHSIIARISGKEAVPVDFALPPLPLSRFTVQTPDGCRAAYTAEQFEEYARAVLAQRGK